MNGTAIIIVLGLVVTFVMMSAQDRQRLTSWGVRLWRRTDPGVEHVPDDVEIVVEKCLQQTCYFHDERGPLGPKTVTLSGATYDATLDAGALHTFHTEVLRLLNARGATRARLQNHPFRRFTRDELDFVFVPGSTADVTPRRVVPTRLAAQEARPPVVSPAPVGGPAAASGSTASVAIPVAAPAVDHGVPVTNVVDELAVEEGVRTELIDGVLLDGFMRGECISTVHVPLGGRVTVGRTASCDLSFPADDTTISRVHLEVMATGVDELLVTGLQGRTPTSLLRDGQHLALGNGDVLLSDDIVLLGRGGLSLAVR